MRLGRDRTFSFAPFILGIHPISPMSVNNPDLILYAQHGWADDHKTIATLAAQLATPKTLVLTPNLGYLKTWLRIEPLIQAVEASAATMIQDYPDVPLRVIGHSMGGLIWTEVLSRHREWWERVESFVLVGSPIGGADLARAVDPLGLGVGIARDLGVNRRSLAEAIAAQIPTLVIAGDIDQGSDGTVVVQCTKIFGAEFVRLSNVDHVGLKNHPAVAAAIQDFWGLTASRAVPAPLLPAHPADVVSQAVIKRLQTVPGMTDAHERDFAKATTWLTFQHGVTLRIWTHPLGIDHVFVADPSGTCLYGGFVGWLHKADLTTVLADLQTHPDVTHCVL